jgi:hypothetical protein
MKYIFPFHKFNEAASRRILFHGSSKVFDKFKPMCFFSEKPQFAIDYADQKSMDYADDSDCYLYTVKLSNECRIFNIHNEEDYKRLEAILPDEISYTYNDFGFSAKEEKAEFMLNLKGFYTNKPEDGIEKVNVGDKIPDPSYNREFLIVYKKDENFVYTYAEKSLQYEIDDRKRPYTDEYKPLYKFIEAYIKEFEASERYISTDTIKAFEYVLMHGEKAYYGTVDPPKEKVTEFHKLYAEYKKTLINKIIDKGYTDKFNIKTTIDPVGDTWRFYENPTVAKAIEKIGYDGYVAVEKKHNTYLIFRPDIHVEIFDMYRV